MKLINKGSSPRYCQLARCVVNPGKTTRELDAFTRAFDSVLELSKGFDILLSEADVDLLARLCSKYLVPLVSNESSDLGEMAGLEQLSATLRDPDGLRTVRERARERRAEIQRLRFKAMDEARKAEERVQSESNYIGQDGNPVPKAEALAAGVEKVEPVRHDEMTTDLRSVLENNLAIMTTASGQPIRNDPKAVVAEPGGTPVPTDPKYYQKLARKTVPGQPDLPKVNNA